MYTPFPMPPPCWRACFRVKQQKQEQQPPNPGWRFLRRSGRWLRSGAGRAQLATSRVTGPVLAASSLAQMDLSGNSFGNKGWFVILTFRKYWGKCTYPKTESIDCWQGNKRRTPETHRSRAPHRRERLDSAGSPSWAHAVGWAAAAHHGTAHVATW